MVIWSSSFFEYWGTHRRSLISNFFRKPAGHWKLHSVPRNDFHFQQLIVSNHWLKLWSFKSQNQFTIAKLIFHRHKIIPRLRRLHHGRCPDHQWRWGPRLWPVWRGQGLLPIRRWGMIRYNFHSHIFYWAVSVSY